ncbi:MAG: hypothetical protein ABL914_03320 [Novosphingobium sp.]|uniref:hypothetical protein n=1 Tax=Novosphingobium sp. TaxID=1874826 RepID=UPI0032BEBAEB
MTIITIDGKNEEDFRREVESDLRHGREAAAAARLRELLVPYAGQANVLPERFLTVAAEELSLRGWDYLGDCISRHDRPGRPVTALSIAFGWAGEEVPTVDEQGYLHPHIETGYFNDAAYPFSQSGRDDLLDGYSMHGCTWSADCEASDNALSLDGADDLCGALAQLEARLLACEEPDPEEIQAGSLGACLLSVLLFQVVNQKIKQDGLPRPVCVTAGSSGVYPYFDAPVVGMPENVRRAAAQAEEDEGEADVAIPGPRYSSLLMTGIPRAQKRAVLVLAETEQEMSVRISRLRGHGDGPAPTGPELEAEALVPEAPVPPVLDDLPESPLMTKKPSGQSWDFRDMLSPAQSGTEAFDQPDEDFWPEDADPEDAGPEEPAGAASEEAQTAPPEAADEPGPAAVADAPSLFEPASEGAAAAEPGFSLLGESVQGRLEILLSPAVPAAQNDPVQAQPWPAEQAGPIWPFGFELIAGNDAAEPDPVAPPAAEPIQGLWARLRHWIRPAR